MPEVVLIPRYHLYYLPQRLDARPYACSWLCATTTLHKKKLHMAATIMYWSTGDSTLPGDNRGDNIAESVVKSASEPMRGRRKRNRNSTTWALQCTVLLWSIVAHSTGKLMLPQRFGEIPNCTIGWKAVCTVVDVDARGRGRRLIICVRRKWPLPPGGWIRMGKWRHLTLPLSSQSDTRATLVWFGLALTLASWLWLLGLISI